MPDDYRQADADLLKGHPLLQGRLPLLEAELLARYGWRTRRVEVYRPELRQQWLFAQGRSAGRVLGHGISASFSRPGPIVTNAWSARVSAHGCTLEIIEEDGEKKTVPAAAAVDLDPLGEDGLPFTKDDPWIPFVAALAAIGPRFGLVHFHAPGKQVTDKPHLQLYPEWSDARHLLVVA